MAAPSPPRSTLEPFSSPKVVYVMGAGRSGSTILGITLGNCENFFYAGELDKWLSRAGVPRVHGADSVRFWETVRENVHGAADLFGVQARCLERSSGLFRIRKWPLRRRLRGPYRRVAEDLYRAVARAAGATYIVDTSHYPLRARELQRLPDVELYLLLLVRDPRSVVASLGRTDVSERTFGTLTANAYLWLTHLISIVVFLRHRRDRRLFVSHEDFTAEPTVVLRQILERLDSPAALPDLGALVTGFPIQGNRLIDSDVVALASGPAAPAPRSRLTTVLQLPWTMAFSRLRAAASGSSAGDSTTWRFPRALR